MIHRLVHHARRSVRCAEAQVALVLGLLVYIFSAHPGLFTQRLPGYQHLGAEYYNIAIAIADGRGFSDPFAELSGSTAWMPPAYPALLAVLLSVLERRELVAEVIVALSNVALTAAGVIAFHAARSWSSRLSPWFAAAFYGFWLWCHYDSVFMVTHDVWLISLLASLLLLALVRFVQRNTVNGWAWGALGGTAMLSSASLGAAWLALTAGAWLRAREKRRDLLVAGALAFSLALPWVARNAVVFGKLIPVKANVFYEAYHANYADDDGIYDGDFRAHPFISPTARFHYAQLGETAFIAEHEAKFRAALAEDPLRYVAAVVNRALAVTVRYVPGKFRRDEGLALRVRQVAYCLPFLGLLLAAAVARGPAQRAVAAIGLMWATYLLPYVLIAFYLRYLAPLSSLLAVMTYLGADGVARAAHSVWRRGLASPIGRPQN